MNKKSINKLNTMLFVGEFVFVLLWVFAGFFLAEKNIGAFFGLSLLAYGVYGETFYNVTKGLIKPIYRGFKRNA